MILPSTSSFVVYADRSSTSNNSLSNPIRVVSQLQIHYEQPNIFTLHAISEARDHENIKSYNDIDEFFSDLEK
jgi:hypothetical protein